LRDRSGKVIRTLDDAGSDPRIAELKLVPPAITEYRNRDGVTLYGAYYAPRDKSLGDKSPLVVMVYGGPHVQRVANAWDLSADLLAQFLAERGFAVWKTDNRGSSRRGHAFESALNRDMGSVEVRDQVDGVRFVAASWPEVDTERVGVSGTSYGGYMTLRCMTEAPEVFRAGVSIAPVTDWDGYDTCYTERYMGTPANNPKGYKASSVLTRADRLQGALLIVHGLLDENVHFRHSARLINALVAAGKPFECLPLPESRHGTRRELDRKYVIERTADFFERSLARAAR
jgi:dipeptidyl-peptidase-4